MILMARGCAWSSRAVSGSGTETGAGRGRRRDARRETIEDGIGTLGACARMVRRTIVVEGVDRRLVRRGRRIIR